MSLQNKSAGSFVYRTSPDPLSKVLKSLVSPPTRVVKGGTQLVFTGRYRRQVRGALMGM